MATDDEESGKRPRQENITPALARQKTGIEIPALMTTLEVTAWLGMNRKAIDKAMEDNDFPQPLQLEATVRRWRRDQIIDWIEAHTPKGKAPKRKVKMAEERKAAAAARRGKGKAPAGGDGNGE